MGFLKKLTKQKSTDKGVKVGKVSQLYLMVDKLKSQQLLETTDQGVFFTYPEIIKLNKDPKPFLRNLYIYARTTNMVRRGAVLQIRDIEHRNLLASILADEVEIFDLNQNKKAED